jgi:hypothetical protein
VWSRGSPNSVFYPGFMIRSESVRMYEHRVCIGLALIILLELDMALDWACRSLGTSDRKTQHCRARNFINTFICERCGGDSIIGEHVVSAARVFSSGYVATDDVVSFCIRGPQPLSRQNGPCPVGR